MATETTTGATSSDEEAMALLIAALAPKARGSQRPRAAYKAPTSVTTKQAPETSKCHICNLPSYTVAEATQWTCDMCTRKILRAANIDYSPTHMLVGRKGDLFAYRRRDPLDAYLDALEGKPKVQYQGEKLSWHISRDEGEGEGEAGPGEKKGKKAKAKAHETTTKPNNDKWLTDLLSMAAMEDLQLAASDNGPAMEKELEQAAEQYARREGR